jgi:hypothetical protein
VYVIALAADYDGTLAEDGIVSLGTVQALEQFRNTGRKLIMVTGRELPELLEVFPRTDLFDRIVAENGALLYEPATRSERKLASPAPSELYEALKARGVAPLSAGRCIIATREPHQTTVLEEIRRLGLELEIIFNKGAVMVLPSGVNKATGLAAALHELRLSPHNVAAIGDAENDHAFLQFCGCDAVVANALPVLREKAHLVMRQARGSGVAEFVGRIEKEDAALMPAARHSILLGTADGEEVTLPAFGKTVLIAGQSGIGKSKTATALMEEMAHKEFQFCVFDPEGDYRELENAICVGDIKVPPSEDEICKLLEQTRDNVVINTLGIAVPERPVFFTKIFPTIAGLRARLARPHWLIVDEAHHILPADREDFVAALPYDFGTTILITVHPQSVSTAALKMVETVIAIGPRAPETISAYCKKTGQKQPHGIKPPGDDEVLYWKVEDGAPIAVRVRKPEQEHKRHTRKYAEGTLPEDQSFYFRGPDNRLNLRAQNTTIFVQIAQGADDETWEYHLRKGEYSRWFREFVKDEELADELAAIEEDRSLSPEESRERVADAVNRRYTAPANAPDSGAGERIDRGPSAR